MSFSKGFQKQALDFSSIGKMVSKTKSGVQAVKGAVTDAAAHSKATYSEGFRGAMGKAPSGTSLGVKSVERANARNAAQGLPNLSQEAANTLQTGKAVKMQERAKNIQDIRAKNKMTFSQKHPVLTTLGVLGAGKAVFGGGEQQQTPPPVAYGSQYYG